MKTEERGGIRRVDGEHDWAMWATVDGYDCYECRSCGEDTQVRHGRRPRPVLGCDSNCHFEQWNMVAHRWERMPDDLQVSGARRI